MSLDEMQLKKVVSHKLKQLMAVRNISETRLSERSHISQSAINRIKNGQVCPSLLQAVQIANYFEITLDEFLRMDEAFQTEKPELGYIPVINSATFLGQGKSQLQGFCAVNGIDNAVAFKFDKSFACNIFNDETILITRSIKTTALKAGDTVLFVKDKKFIVGSYHHKTLKPLDNLAASFKLADVDLVGLVVKIETHYIDEPSAIQKISQAIGPFKLQQVIDIHLSHMSKILA